jgi:fatty-acyl-CoA synthase
MLRLLDKVSDPDVAVLWDVHHPFRYMAESVEKTYGALKDYIAFVHLKDSVMQNGKVRYKMLGRGDIPVRTAVGLLKDNGYQGFVSLEWVKRWCADLEEPGVVFSHFANYMQGIL